MKLPKGMLPFWKGWRRGIIEVCTAEATLWSHLSLLVQILLYPILYCGFYLWLNFKGEDNG